MHAGERVRDAAVWTWTWSWSSSASSSPSTSTRPPMATALNSHAVDGFADAAAYDQHRPSYPPSAVEALLHAAGVGGVTGARVVDLAAGTGKWTEQLASRPERYSIVAVEPHDAMRRQLSSKALDRVAVVDGLSTAMPLDDCSVDALFAAQAFHWFADEASLKEIHRVLKPGGVLAMVWNAEEYNTPLTYPLPPTSYPSLLRTHLFSLSTPLSDHAPRFRHNTWRRIFDSQLSSTPLTTALVSGTNSLFSLPLGEKTEEWSIYMSEDALWSRFKTMGHVAQLDVEGLAETRRVFEGAMKGDGVVRNERGEVEVKGVTVMAWTGKIP
ncbi:S-adenosyl-L-methionine-dependent methyltransferase [Polyplosphaeria fusca]|uniref:S-adenosyl-L-methionine-dependent methyltransferase n=1 Tax=Polyplosphaeria fusca TaxID=682080 RepID=A0A9P4QZ54_9PLEO|nr:S-adenosyl-L-methionine-dependent methyltransferase [Polyplosphaeria fusca]